MGDGRVAGTGSLLSEHLGPMTWSPAACYMPGFTGGRIHQCMCFKLRPSKPL